MSSSLSGPENFNPRVLVTGAAGFIGSYLCELLLKKSCLVVGIDSFASGSLANLSRCLTDENFSFHKVRLYQVSQLGSFNYLFHLDTSRENSSALPGLLKTAAESRAKFLFLSRLSSAQDNELEVSESLVREAIRAAGLNARIVRTKNSFGPRMSFDDRDPVQALLKNAAERQPLIVHGSQTLVHPTFVADLVYGLTAAMFSLGTEGKTYALYPRPGVTLDTFVRSLKEVISPELKIEYLAARSSSQANSVDLSPEDGELVGWQPDTSLADALKLTVRSFPAPPAVSTASYPEPGKSGQKSRRQPRKIRLPSLRSISPARGRRHAAKPASAKTLSQQGTDSKRSLPIFLRGNYNNLKDRGKTRPSSRERGFNIGSKIVLPLLVFLLIFFLPLSFLAVNGLLGLRQLQQVQTDLLSADLVGAKANSLKSRSSLKRAGAVYVVYSRLLAAAGQPDLASRLDKLFTIGRELSDGIVLLVDAADQTASLGKIVFQNQSGDIPAHLALIKSNTDQAYLRFSTAQAVAFSEKNLLPVDIPFTRITELLTVGREALSAAPELIGLNGKRTYLVLFQNNMELRPTGGFIGSYGLVTFDKGKMIDFEVSDVYAADGQLKGHVEPPAELKKYLGEAGWYLRDSNWHPDFVVSAQRAEWFLEKEIARSVDGVVGINLYLVQDLLRRTGELTLADFQETITADNLFERAEYHSEVNFFPGSTQKSDFLGSLARALLDKVKTADQAVWLAVAESVWRSLGEKDLLLALHDPAAAALVSGNGWDGRLSDIACLSSVEAACLIDYLMINEANVGVNKANYFVQRQVAQELALTPEGAVERTLRLVYRNSSPSENFPAGRYKNYLRLIVPAASRLDSVSLDGEKIPDSDIEIQDISGRQSFGFLMEVPIRSEKTVEVRYTLAETINYDQAVRYLLFWQKQSGIRDEQVSLLMTAPPGITLFDPNPPGQKSKFVDDQTGETRESLTFTPGLTEDLVLEIGVSR